MDESSVTGDCAEIAVLARTTNASNAKVAQDGSVLSDCRYAPREQVAVGIFRARMAAEPYRLTLGHQNSARRGARTTAALRRAIGAIATGRKSLEAKTIEPDSSPDSGERSDESRGASFVLIYTGGRFFRTRELLNSVTELETRAAQLGARVVYENGWRSGTLQASRYVIARFNIADPLGW